MPTINLAIENFPKQQSIFDHPAKYKIVAKGRRFGLTKGAANDYIESALAKKFKQGLWIDTVNSNIERYVERYFLPHLRKLSTLIWNWRKQAKIMQMLDSYIDFRSADRPENIEGFGYDKFFINEAGIVLKNEYLWNNAIRPMMWEFPNVQGVIGGTPKGLGTFYELAERGKDESQPEYKFFHFTTFDNPYLTKEIILEEIDKIPETVAKQEIYAQFLEDSGVVFRGVTKIATATPKKPIKGHVYVMGVDLAKVEDFTVITVYDRKDNCQVYQDRFNKIEYPFQKEKIKSVSKHYNGALIIMDATGVGDPIVDDLLRARVPVEPYKFTNQSKKELIEKLVIWTEQQKIKILPIKETLAEFRNFTYDVSSSGRIRYEAPQGFHDDIVIAHGLAVWSLAPIYKQEKVKEPTLIQREYRKRSQGGYEYF